MTWIADCDHLQQVRLRGSRWARFTSRVERLAWPSPPRSVALSSQVRQPALNSLTAAHARNSRSARLRTRGDLLDGVARIRPDSWDAGLLGQPTSGPKRPGARQDDQKPQSWLRAGDFGSERSQLPPLRLFAASTPTNSTEPVEVFESHPPLPFGRGRCRQSKTAASFDAG